MKKRMLGNGLEVSAIGLGCMGLSHAYGAPTEKREAIALIRKAYEMGYTFFDTAEVYGPYANEELVGDALHAVRDKVIIATKFGVRLAHGSTGTPLPDSRPEVIRVSVEGSLKRLHVDCIDLYYQHRVDPNVPIEEVAAAMQLLMDEGKIRHWGISEVTEDILRRAHQVCPVTAIQNRYSMMARHYESLFPLLEELKIGFVGFSPMANGFLTGKYDKFSRFEQNIDYRSMMPQFTADGIEKNRGLLELLRAKAEKKDSTPAQISLAWMLCKKPWIIPIPGTRQPERLAENAGAAEIVLTVGEVNELDKVLGMIPMSEVFGGTRKEK